MGKVREGESSLGSGWNMDGNSGKRWVYTLFCIEEAVI